MNGEPVFVCQKLIRSLHLPAITVKPFVYKDLAMNVKPLSSPRFIRKTQLAPNEYRKNFQQIDREILAAITSEEADRVTPLMSKVYLRLVNAPARFWEREGVLRIEAEEREEKLVKAWIVLCDLVGVSSATASKALRWMHEQGIIGYFSGKNGVGLRIFFNRAASSIGVRQSPAGKKILAFPPASSGESPASPKEAAFNDSYAVLENLDTDVNSDAPQNGADRGRVDKSSSTTTLPRFAANPDVSERKRTCATSMAESKPGGIKGWAEVVTCLRAELEPAIHAAARQAAAREHERTREWLERRGLPKAARVAQHEAYNLLRRYGLVSETARNGRAHAEVGRDEATAPSPRRLDAGELEELAGACIAMLETKGQSIERTLAEMSVDAGGFLLPEDVVKVREQANTLLLKGESRERK